MGASAGERLLLWAVDGLAGVVLSGRPGTLGGGGGLRTPRAVLWGQHAGQLAWPPPAVRDKLHDTCDATKGQQLWLALPLQQSLAFD